MLIRESMEQREKMILSPYASLSINSKGRDREERPCDIRTCYQRDRDRILHSKSFRRLKHKTQVFLSPEGDHYRTRLTHTLEVAQIARTIAKALQLNEDLTEAIALGHDLGHTPYGHSGETALNDVMEHYGMGFKHYEQSIRVVELLEKDGAGLNLTWEVRDGIRNHGMSKMPSTLEGKIVRLSDKIAYINHDIDDAIRGGVIVESDIPAQYGDVLGKSVRDRLNFLVHDIISHSLGKDDICQSKDAAAAMVGLRKYMFDYVYSSPIVKSEEKKAQQMLKELFFYYYEHIEEIPSSYQIFLDRGEKRERVVCDYIAGMTDPFAVACYEELFVPKSWKHL